MMVHPLVNSIFEVSNEFRVRVWAHLILVNLVLFSGESNSRITNVLMSVCPLPKPL